MEAVLDLSRVTKVYRGRVRALDDISMRIDRGAIFGLLGPNGAGKSTLVKILMTVIRPTRCEGTMLGDRVGRKATLRRVGYLPEHHRFPDYLTGAQVLDFYGSLTGTPRHVRRRRAGELLELVGMTAWAHHRVRQYSKGMRQRIGIAQALINDPDFVVLDEPTDGVDPVGRRDIRRMMEVLRDSGKTVLINSHLLSELEMVCDRVAILVKGKVVSQGKIGDLTRHLARYEIELDALEGAGPGPLLQLPIAWTDAPSHDLDAPLSPPGAAPPTRNGAIVRIFRGTLATGETVEVERGIIRVDTLDAARVQTIIDSARARGIVVRTVREVRPSLEDLFMQAVTDPETGRTFAPGAEKKR